MGMRNFVGESTAFTAPGWVRDEQGRLARETKPHMGRRLPGFDYRQRRIYEITVVLEERRPILGRLVKSRGVSASGPGDAQWAWSVKPSSWGEVVLDCWQKIPGHWPQVSLVECQLMPDHFHGILFVEAKLPRGKTLGNIVGGFKAGCTKGWREVAATSSLSRREPDGLPPSRREPDGPAPSPTGDGIPRWASGYVDVILFGKGQLERMVAYLRDNPRRLGIKREHPELFKVTRALNVAGIGWFSAIGNHFLLSRPVFHQIQASRRFFAYARDTRGHIMKNAPPAVATPEFKAKLDAALAAAKGGAVLVSPCISHGEREIARRAFASGCRVITLANKGFSPLYKPGGQLFESCANGNLLMLAPAGWPYQPAEKPMTRLDALVLNRIAQLIAGESASAIDYKGMSLENVDSEARKYLTLGPECSKL